MLLDIVVHENINLLFIKTISGFEKVSLNGFILVLLAWEFETNLLDCSYLEQFSSNWVPFLEYESTHNELYVYKVLLDYIKYIFFKWNYYILVVMPICLNIASVVKKSSFPSW